jgi:hypothetical protein
MKYVTVTACSAECHRYVATLVLPRLNTQEVLLVNIVHAFNLSTDSR